LSLPPGDPLARYCDDDLAHIDQLLDQLLNLPEQARSEWLEAQIKSNPSLTEALRSAQHQLATLRTEEHEFNHASAAIDCSSVADLPAHCLAPDTQLGPWKITEKVASGGSADVYRGERIDGQFKRAVAIKVLREKSADWQRRFARERVLLASLEHPHIAGLLDAGHAADAGAYLVMPWLAGADFSAWRAQQASSAEKLREFLGLVDAVAYAHQRSVVHRDLKPTNIRSDASGRLLLLDFGISLLLDTGESRAALAGQLATSQATLSALTPSYASPEQLAGEPATTLSDIHALGLLLYELLFDQSAYPEAVRSLAHAVQSICGPALPALNPHRLKMAWRASQAQDLCAVLERCLQKNPSLRYASALELAHDLRAVLANLAIRARPRTMPQRFYAVLQRHPLRFAALTSLLSVGLFFAHVYVKQNQQIAAERTEALAQVRRLEALREHFSLILRSASSGAESARAALDESTRQLGQSYQAQPAEYAQLLLSLGEVYLAAGDNQAVMSVLQSLVDKSEVLASLGETQVSQAFETLLFAGLRIAKPEQVAAWLERWRSKLPSDSTRAAHPRWAIVQAMWQRQNGDVNTAFTAQQRAVAQLAQAPDATPLSIGIAWSNLGSSALQLGDFNGAALHYQRALATWKTNGIEENDNVRTAQTNLGHISALQGDPVAALAQYRAVEQALRARGANSAPFAALLNGIARSEMQLGNFAEALEHAQAAVAILEKISGPSSIDVLGVLVSQLEAMAYLNQPVQQMIGRINSIAKTLPTAHPVKVRAQLSVQRLRYLQAPNTKAARAQFERLTEQVAAGPPSLRPAAVRSYLDLAGSALAQPEQAKQFVAKAMALLKSSTRLQSLDLTEALLWQNCLQNPKKLADAELATHFAVISLQHPRRAVLTGCLART
jgi:eukaryotic-like serine/threonine-protein kinase